MYVRKMKKKGKEEERKEKAGMALTKKGIEK